MKRLILLILCLALLPHAALAQRVGAPPSASNPFSGMAGSTAPAASEAPMPLTRDKVAAVVNDNVITTNDIDTRMKLALLSSGLPATQEVAQHLLPQVLRGLIDEQLQTQEAKRLDISVSKDDVDKALERIAQDNHIPGDMRAYVREHGGSAEALERQIRASISWNRVVQRELRPRVEVGDDEVDAVIERVRANAGKEEFLVSEIVLAVDTPKDDDNVKQVAENLVQQIKGGANFGAVARQFSQDTGAASGGDIGWIQEGQLPSELNSVLVTLKPGDIAGPIHTASGYHIIGLREKRTITLGGADASETTLSLQQVFRPFAEDENRDTVAQEAAQLRLTVNGCADLQSQIGQKFPAWHWQNLGQVQLAKLPPDFAGIVHDVTPGKSTEPLATDKGALIIFVCDKHIPEGKADRDAIMNSIGTEKMELQARRLMRDLRRSAYVDIRLGNG